MLKKISEKAKKYQDGYVAETEVYDTITEEKYYVVCRTGDLLYATFDSSYFDYLIENSGIEPKMLEGEKYYWYDDSKNPSRFKEF